EGGAEFLQGARANVVVGLASQRVTIDDGLGVVHGEIDHATTLAALRGHDLDGFAANVAEVLRNERRREGGALHDDDARNSVRVEVHIGHGVFENLAVVFIHRAVHEMHRAAND